MDCSTTGRTTAGLQTPARSAQPVYRGPSRPVAGRLHPAGFQWIDANDADQSVLSFLRWAAGPGCCYPVRASTRSPRSPRVHWGSTWSCVANFTPVPQHGYRVGLPVPAGGGRCSTPTPSSGAAPESATTGRWRRRTPVARADLVDRAHPAAARRALADAGLTMRGHPPTLGDSDVSGQRAAYVSRVVAWTSRAKQPGARGRPDRWSARAVVLVIAAGAGLGRALTPKRRLSTAPGRRRAPGQPPPRRSGPGPRCGGDPADAIGASRCRSNAPITAVDGRSAALTSVQVASDPTARPCPARWRHLSVWRRRGPSPTSLRYHRRRDRPEPHRPAGAATSSSPP